MDWVVNASKYDVDYNFGMVDIDSIMARIESSKESLRNSTIPDADGANEVYGVTLTPNRWATYCRRKAEGWYERNGTYTLAQLDAEIERLTNLQSSFQTTDDMISSDNNEYPASGATPPASDLEALRADHETKLRALYSAQGRLSGAKYNAQQVFGNHDSTEDQKKAAQTSIDNALKEVQDAEKAVQAATETYDSARIDHNEYERLSLAGQSKQEIQTWITGRQATIRTELERLNGLRAAKLAQEPVTVPVITGATAPENENDDEPHGTLVAPEGSEQADAIFKTTAPGGTTPVGTPISPPMDSEDANPWTSITFSYSATDLKTSSSQSSWGFSVGGHVGFGLWSAGGSYSHDESHSEMQSDMAACEISVSFSAMVVNINRPWLYGELFSDIDLELAEGARLSPGPLKMHQMIKDQNVNEMNNYSQFPAYPTAFIVAADTTIEFKGSTKHIEEKFDSHSNSASASVGFGPWHADASFHEQASKSSMQMHTTATGCKLMFGAPQVIAWASQILPALPREAGFNPLTQGAGIPLPT